MGSCISGWPQTYCIVKDGLELLTLLPPTPKCWCGLPCLAFVVVLGIKQRDSLSMLGERSAHRATLPTGQYLSYLLQNPTFPLHWVLRIIKMPWDGNGLTEEPVAGSTTGQRRIGEENAVTHYGDTNTFPRPK